MNPMNPSFDTFADVLDGTLSEPGGSTALARGWALGPSPGSTSPSEADLTRTPTE